MLFLYYLDTKEILRDAGSKSFVIIKDNMGKIIEKFGADLIIITEPVAKVVVPFNPEHCRIGIPNYWICSRAIDNLRLKT